MLKSELDYTYPEELIATQPAKDSRILLAALKVGDDPKEITKEDLLHLFQPGDALVINETKVIKKKVPAITDKQKDVEVLFLEKTASKTWQVLFPLKKCGKEKSLKFEGGFQATVTEGGMPQTIAFSEELPPEFFEKYGRMPLPDYIEKMRSEKKVPEDESWYQTDWAKIEGSSAAPTASLHFTTKDLESLKDKGVRIVPLCLHIGLGTFQPIQVDNIKEHPIHEEEVLIPKSSLKQILETKKEGKKVWSLGTTVCRSLESYGQNLLKFDEKGNAFGPTDLYIYPGYKFQVMDHLLTNFHQPKTSLLALVAALSSIDNVKRNYEWAIERRFRLFSYGDLSVWYRS